MRLPEPAEDFVLRVDDVAHRLRELAEGPAPTGLTEPDPPTGERWDGGQVWAHLAEFIPYWIEQIDLIRTADGPEPAPFGRVKSDPGRIAAIETDRYTRPSELMARIDGQLDDLRTWLAGLSPDDWGKRGVHETLGVQEVRDVVDEMLVGHLEEHADQLDGLARGGS